MSTKRPELEGKILILFLVTLVMVTTMASRAAARTERFEETATVIVVEVPVQVTKDGEPVRGLTAEDFEVIDGRKQREIIGFDVIDLALNQPGESSLLSVAELPVAARRHFLLFFDLSFSEPATILRARQAALDLVQRGLHPTDLAAVATYSASQGIKVVLGFTSDRAQVRYAIETLGLAEPLPPIRDPLGFLIADLGTGVPEIDKQSKNQDYAISTEAELLETYRDLQAMSERVVRDQKQNQILALASAMNGLAGLMNSVQGRVELVLLSEGFDTSVALGNTGESAADMARLEEINDAAMRGEVWKVDSDARFGSSASLSGLGDMLEEFRRAGVTIQAVDIGGLRAGPGATSRSKGDDGLFLMANETGGELYRNYNDLGNAMTTLLVRTSVSYVLAFQPDDLAADGTYHKLKVRLTGGPKGARITHRPGYYAPKPFALQTPMEKRLATAERIMGRGAGGDFSTAVLAASFETPGQGAHVSVVIEVDGPDLLAQHPSDALGLEIYTYAVAEDGSVSDFFTQAIGLDLAKVGGVLGQGGFRFFGDLTLEPGHYLIRALVRDSDTGTTSVSLAPVRVPALATGEAVLLPPFFPSASNNWVMARLQAVTDTDIPYPYLRQGQPFIPTALPAIRTLTPVPLCLEAYNLATGSLSLTGHIETRDGARVEDADITLVGDPGQSWSADGCRDASLIVPAVATGDYQLVVTLRDTTSGREHSSSIPIVVENP